MQVLALRAEPVVETLDVCVLDGLPRSDERERYVTRRRPRVEGARHGLRAFGHGEYVSYAAEARHVVEYVHDPCVRERCIHLERQTLAYEGVDEMEDAKAPPSRGLSADEVLAHA